MEAAKVPTSGATPSHSGRRTEAIAFPRALPERCAVGSPRAALAGFVAGRQELQQPAVVLLDLDRRIRRQLRQLARERDRSLQAAELIDERAPCGLDPAEDAPPADGAIVSSGRFRPAVMRFRNRS